MMTLPRPYVFIGMAGMPPMYQKTALYLSASRHLEKRKRLPGSGEGAVTGSEAFCNFCCAFAALSNTAAYLSVPYNEKKGSIGIY